MLIQHNDSKWQSRSTFTHLLPRKFQNCNSLLNNYQQENVESHQKKETPRPRAKEKPQKDSRKGETAFTIKPHYLTEMLGGLKQTLVHTGPRDPTETEPDLPLSV